MKEMRTGPATAYVSALARNTNPLWPPHPRGEEREVKSTPWSTQEACGVQQNQGCYMLRTVSSTADLVACVLAPRACHVHVHL